MEYQIRTEGSVSVLELNGDLDVSSAPTLQTALQQLMDDGRQLVVLDLGAVPFMDSSGLGVLVAANRRLIAAGGQIALASAAPALRKVFQLTRTNRLFKLYDAVSDAVAEIGSHGAGLSANLGK